MLPFASIWRSSVSFTVRRAAYACHVHMYVLEDSILLAKRCTNECSSRVSTEARRVLDELEPSKSEKLNKEGNEEKGWGLLA